jgi:hypothetical protein
MRKMKRFYGVVLSALLMCGCGSQVAKQTIEQYNEVFAKVIELEKVVNQSDWKSFDGTQIREIYNVGKDLYYDYNPMDLTVEQIAACDALKARIAKLREDIVLRAEAEISDFKITPYSCEDKLFEKTEVFPVYLKKGEKLRWSVSGTQPIVVKISNADSRKVVKTYSGKSKVKDSLSINNTAIYLVEVNPKGTQYISYDINYKITEISRLTDATKVLAEQVESTKGAFGAVGVTGVKMHNCFEQPRKFTLRGQLKAAFSGSAKALVPVQVPAGTTDILYTMRIATSEQDRSSDGEFHDNLTRSYSRIKFLGLPLYERSSSNGLLNTLLDDNRPLREEDAYCNMYLFRSQSQAKQFQDGTKAASLLSYDVDYSTVGTQSCSGRIPMKGTRTVYLAFENERMRYTNYLWVEVVAVVPTTEYYTTKYTIEN